MDDIEELCSKR